MERDPDVLVVGQPTRGVDIGAIEFIHNQIIPATATEGELGLMMAGIGNDTKAAQ